MSLAYDQYLRHHVQNIHTGMTWILNHIDSKDLDDILPSLNKHELEKRANNHDLTKFMENEYVPYDNYFYHGGHNTKEGQKSFDEAWLHHIHNNPHHWQYWVLIDDDGDFSIGSNKVKAIDIPDKYIFEMICDWWTFSWDKFQNNMAGGTQPDYQNLYEIFSWYDDHKDKMILSSTSRNKVEDILSKLREALDTHMETTKLERL